MNTSSWGVRILFGACIAVCVVGLLPDQASARVCASFCKRAATAISNVSRDPLPYTLVTVVEGIACTSGTQCTTLPPCPSGTSVASLTEAERFCQLARRPVDGVGYRNPYATPESAWCATFVPADVNGGCWMTADERAAFAARVAADTTPVSDTPARPTVSDTPIPPPVNPGEGFRCRFLCSNDTSARDGQTCSAMTDTAACLTQCNTTCRAAGETCLGSTGSNANSDQAPRCIPAQPPAASVGGLVDTQRFETLNETFGNLSIPKFIGSLIKTMLGVAGALFFAMLVWGGIRWMTAGGDSGSVKSAKTITTNAVIGVIMIVLSYTIVTAFMQIVVQFATTPS